MSKQLFVILLAIGSLAVDGCQSSSADPDDAVHALAGEGPESLQKILYPIEDARNDVIRYDSICHEYLKDTPIKAFRVGSLDLLRAMGMRDSFIRKEYCQYDYVRVYIGYGKDSAFKLFVVPVQESDSKGTAATDNPGKDLYFNAQGQILKHEKSSGSLPVQLFVMDLNAPCPNTCDTGSLLNPITPAPPLRKP